VFTKSHEDAQQWVWSSSVGSHQYTIREDDDPAHKMARGTRVVLHLKVCLTARGVGAWRRRWQRGGHAKGCAGTILRAPVVRLSTLLGCCAPHSTHHARARLA
jgi:hypothetical protein